MGGRPGARASSPAGRSAFNSLRLEKGYRLWGTDMTAEHDPYEAGLGFAVKPDKGDFVGRDGARGPPPRLRAAADLPGARRPRRTSCWARSRSSSTARRPATSPAPRYGYTIGRAIAYAWLPALRRRHRRRGRVLRPRCPATVSAEPLVDPSMSRIRAVGAAHAVATYDVIVVGLGGMGSAAAYHLAARGQRVLGLERLTPAPTTRARATAARGSPGSPTSRTRRTCRCCCAPTSCGTRLAARLRRGRHHADRRAVRSAAPDA